MTHHTVGAGLAPLDGFPFEVRHSEGALARAETMAALAADACRYLGGLFGETAPDIALLVADEGDWPSRSTPYGLPYFNDDDDQIRPGILVMAADRGGEVQSGMVDDLRAASPRSLPRLRAAYPDGAGGIDLMPLFDLITIHELGHAFEVLGDLRLPTDWLSEIFVNLALHAFVATRRPQDLPTLEVLPSIGAGSRRLAARMRAEGFSTLEQLDAHYAGGDDPMSPLNYVWYQYRWQRLVARVFARDGEAGLTRFWACFHGRDRVDRDAEADPDARTARALAPLLTREVSATLGRAIRDWR